MQLENMVDRTIQAKFHWPLVSQHQTKRNPLNQSINVPVKRLNEIVNYFLKATRLRRQQKKVPASHKTTAKQQQPHSIVRDKT